MIPTRADIRLVLSALRNGTPLEGALVGEVLRDVTLTDGTEADGARAINRMLYREGLTIASGVSETIDLQTEPAPPDAALNLSTVKVFYCRALSTNSAELVVDFSTVNGWNNEIDGTVSLAPGGEVLWIATASASNVDGTHKIVNFSHGGPLDQVLEKLLVLGATV